jgi:metalloendopeptidase OMA1, mitochondrial
MGPFGNRSGQVGQGGRRGLKLWPILLFGAYFAYYYFSHSNEASFTGRKQLLDSSAQEEAALGLQSYREILSQSNVVTSGPLPQQVREIAQRLVEAAPKVEKYLADSAGVPATTDWSAFNWEVSVIQSDEVNAFCLPGGKIAVYTGIVPVAANNDGLAAIMGHEIAHALLRHGGERMAQQKLVQIGSIAATMSTGEMDPQQRQMVMAAIGAGAQYGVLLPFSRSHESEADRVGLLLSAAACYNPEEAPRLWERMAALGRQKPPEFMSTHPAEGTRITQLQSWMAEAQQIRQQLCTTGGAPAQ